MVYQTSWIGERVSEDKLKKTKVDEIQMEMIQAFSLYNECLRQRNVLNIWKQAEVIIMIIKKWDNNDLTKPISYTPKYLLDVMEKLQKKFFCKGLKEHPNIRGLRQGRSTEVAVN